MTYDHDKMSMYDALEKCQLRWPKGGKLFCPAHKEKTPSLHIYKDSFYCFSCGKSGDAYGFIALWTGRDIVEVLKQYRPREDSLLHARKEVMVAVGPNAMDQRRRRQWTDMNRNIFGTLHRVFGEMPTQMLLDEIERMHDQFGALGEAVVDMVGFDYERSLRDFERVQLDYLNRADARLNGWQLGALRGYADSRHLGQVADTGAA